MTWPTHALLGISSLWIIAPLPPELLGYSMGVLAACAALGALLPDLDASESKVKHLKIPGTKIKPFLLPAQVVHRTEQHRGLLHLLRGLGMVTLMTMPFLFLIGWAPILTLLIGYASHLLGDAATKSGVRLLYPSATRVHLLPKGWRITTGSLAEEALIAPLALLAIVLLLGSPNQAL